MPTMRFSSAVLGIARNARSSTSGPILQAQPPPLTVLVSLIFFSSLSMYPFSPYEMRPPEPVRQHRIPPWSVRIRLHVKDEFNPFQLFIARGRRQKV